MAISPAPHFSEGKVICAATRHFESGRGNADRLEKVS